MKRCYYPMPHVLMVKSYRDIDYGMWYFAYTDSLRIIWNENLSASPSGIFHLSSYSDNKELQNWIKKAPTSPLFQLVSREVDV